MLASYYGREGVVKYLCNQCRIDPFVKSIEVRLRMNDMLM